MYEMYLAFHHNFRLALFAQHPLYNLSIPFDPLTGNEIILNRALLRYPCSTNIFGIADSQHRNSIVTLLNPQNKGHFFHRSCATTPQLNLAPASCKYKDDLEYWYTRNKSALHYKDNVQSTLGKRVEKKIPRNVFPNSVKKKKKKE